jgi:hypothetical protein
MNAANQHDAMSVAISDAVVVVTTDASFGARGRHFGKSKLRSQNLALAFLTLPPGMVCFSKEIIDFSKRILSSVHRHHHKAIFSSLSRKIGAVSHPFGLSSTQL